MVAHLKNIVIIGVCDISQVHLCKAWKMFFSSPASHMVCPLLIELAGEGRFGTVAHQETCPEQAIQCLRSLPTYIQGTGEQRGPGAQK